MELALDPIKRTGRAPIRDSGTNHMAATNALQAQLTHQSLYRAASNIKALTLELLPDFHDAITLHIVIPDALDFIDQPLVLLDAGTSQFGLTGFDGMQVVTGRSDLDDATDRLDSVPVAVLVNKSIQDFLRRSSSAWAKYALGREHPLIVRMMLRRSLDSGKTNPGFGIVLLRKNNTVTQETHDLEQKAYMPCSPHRCMQRADTHSLLFHPIAFTTGWARGSLT